MLFYFLRQALYNGLIAKTTTNTTIHQILISNNPGKIIAKSNPKPMQLHLTIPMSNQSIFSIFEFKKDEKLIVLICFYFYPTFAYYILS